MLRSLLAGLILLASVAGTGCGDDADRSAGSRDDGPFVSLTEAESVLERGALAVVRTGGGVDVGGVDGEPDLAEASLVDAARYESQSGREFDVFVFTSAAAARRAARVIIDLKDRESGIRAANVVTVFPQPFDEVDAYRAVARALRRLRTACDPGGRGDPRLRRICFAEQPPVPPPGEGVDRDEAEDEEEPIVVGGLHYDPQIARRLNPRIAPDRAMVAGRMPPAGTVWFGVFLRVCNRGDEVRASSDQLALVDAFGERTEPSDVPAPNNAFAYENQSIKPGDCFPREGSAAARIGDGALVLFAVAPALLGDPPIALEVQGQRVILDL